MVMRPYTILIICLTSVSTAWAHDFGTLIFKDTFDRTESQEERDGPGNEWTTSSDKTAKGHKEVDLRDGHMYIYTHAEANHATSVRHAFEFGDGTLGLRFKIEEEDDSLTLNFADLGLKSVWAEHLFKVTIGSNSVKITDQKTGEMDLEIREAQKENRHSPRLISLLIKKRMTFPHKITVNEWHHVYTTVAGDKITCSIDGVPLGSFRSEGFAHQTKRLLRLLLPKNAYVDDVEIWRRS